MSTSNVYLLVFPKVNAVKIGKADDLSARIGTLERSWGKPDYSASWRFPVPAGIVLSVERGLHYFLSRHRLKLSPGAAGGGHTELFSMNALDAALKFLELYCSLNKLSGPEQGVPEPDPPQQKKFIVPEVTPEERLAWAVPRLHALFDRLDRWVRIFKHYAPRWRYQCYWRDNTVCLMLETTEKRAKEYWKMIWLGTDYLSALGTGSSTCCDGMVGQHSPSENGKSYYQIDFQYYRLLVKMHAREQENDGVIKAANAIVAKRLPETLARFAQIPARSPLLTEDVPLFHDP